MGKYFLFFYMRGKLNNETFLRRVLSVVGRRTIGSSVSHFAAFKRLPPLMWT
jgi:hypothetical protein